jgi:predicted ATP-dependent protease
VIPRSNLRNLMLRRDVIEAVKAGKFHVYAVNTIDDGIEVLTGVSAGERGGDGSYPEGSVNHLVQKKLQQFTEQQRKLSGETQIDSAAGAE